MFYCPNDGHGLKHNPLTSLVVPRPIGWISTLNRNGIPNLAPFSFFNLVGYQPPTVMFCANETRSDGHLKDTAQNAIETGEFVCNMATWSLRHQCNLTGADVESEIDEFDLAQLEKLPSKIVNPPRVAESPIQLECKTSKYILLPGRIDVNVVFGEVVGIHIKDDAIVDGIVDIGSIKPLARMGYADYTHVDDVYVMPRPK